MNINLSTVNPNPEKKERNREIYKKYLYRDQGVNPATGRKITIRDLAKEYGLTFQRVSQIIHKEIKKEEP